MEIRDWIELAGFVLATIGAIIGSVRYIDSQIAGLKLKMSDRSVDVDRQMSDKISIGEYTRRHEDLERRLRDVERWQDRINGELDRHTRNTT